MKSLDVSLGLNPVQIAEQIRIRQYLLTDADLSFDHRETIQEEIEKLQLRYWVLTEDHLFV